MTLNDPIANALSKVLNAEKAGKTAVTIRHISKVMKQVLEVMQQEQFVGEFTEIEDGRGNYIELQLIGNVNACGVVKPRFPVQLHGYEKYEKRYLPAKGFGILLVSTPKGMMKHTDAIDQGLGGRLIAYVY